MAYIVSGSLKLSLRVKTAGHAPLVICEPSLFLSDVRYAGTAGSLAVNRVSPDTEKSLVPEPTR